MLMSLAIWLKYYFRRNALVYVKLRQSRMSGGLHCNADKCSRVSITNSRLNYTYVQVQTLFYNIAKIAIIVRM